MQMRFLCAGPRYAARDRPCRYVNGTTQLRSIPAAGTFRIYDLAGHNIGTGVLSAAMTLYNCGANGCYFGFQTAFTANTGCFTPSPQNWFEFGLDIFQESGGSDEGAARRAADAVGARWRDHARTPARVRAAFCIEIANDNYVQYEEASQIPSPGVCVSVCLCFCVSVRVFLFLCVCARARACAPANPCAEVPSSPAVSPVSRAAARRLRDVLRGRGVGPLREPHAG